MGGCGEGAVLKWGSGLGMACVPATACPSPLCTLRAAPRLPPPPPTLQVLPGVDAAQFTSGSSRYRRRVITQQARLAGRQAGCVAGRQGGQAGAEQAAAEGDGAEGGGGWQRLMVEACELAVAYGVPVSELHAAFVAELLPAAAAVTHEVCGGGGRRGGAD